MEFSAKAFREYQVNVESKQIEQEKLELQAKLVSLLQSGQRNWCRIPVNTHVITREWLRHKGFRLVEDEEQNALECHWDEKS